MSETIGLFNDTIKLLNPTALFTLRIFFLVTITLFITYKLINVFLFAPATAKLVFISAYVLMVQDFMTHSSTIHAVLALCVWLIILIFARGVIVRFTRHNITSKY